MSAPEPLLSLNFSICVLYTSQSQLDDAVIFGSNNQFLTMSTYVAIH